MTPAGIRRTVQPLLDAKQGPEGKQPVMVIVVMEAVEHALPVAHVETEDRSIACCAALRGGSVEQTVCRADQAGLRRFSVRAAKTVEDALLGSRDIDAEYRSLAVGAAAHRRAHQRAALGDKKAGLRRGSIRTVKSVENALVGCIDTQTEDRALEASAATRRRSVELAIHVDQRRHRLSAIGASAKTMKYPFLAVARPYGKKGALSGRAAPALERCAVEPASR